MGKRIRVSGFLVLLAVVGFISMSFEEADAIPSFSRKYEVNCNSCHTAWPMLNAQGRAFKENGYRMSREDTAKDTVISDFLRLDKTLPVSAVLVSRPYDEKKSGRRKMEALKEAELMVAGVLYKNVSGFLELEAENENDFTPELESGVLGYHPEKYFNLLLSYSEMLRADPYDTYSNKRRLTRGAYSVVDQTFGGADNNGKLLDSRQAISIYGRPIEKLFYSIGLSGIAKDKEGENASNLHARIAVDVVPDITVGLLGVSGKWDKTDGSRDFTRLGIDLQADYGNSRLTGAYLKAEDDITVSKKEKNDALYLQAMHVIANKNRPWIVPLLRFDSYENNDGGNKYNELTLNCAYYFTQNIKGIAEYWTQTKTPSDVEKDKRFTIQITAAF